MFLNSFAICTCNNLHRNSFIAALTRTFKSRPDEILGRVSHKTTATMYIHMNQC